MVAADKEAAKPRFSSS